MHKLALKLQRVSLADVAALQKLGRQTFMEAFSWANSPEDMQSYLEEAFSLETLSREIDSAASAMYFVKEDSKPVGYLKVNFASAQEELVAGKGLEVQRIYVLKEFYGKKIGEMLLQKALEIASERQLDYVWLGVWEKNSRAIAFYEKWGFTRFGTKHFKLGNDLQTDLLMKLALKKNV